MGPFGAMGTQLCLRGSPCWCLKVVRFRGSHKIAGSAPCHLPENPDSLSSPLGRRRPEDLTQLPTPSHLLLLTGGTENCFMEEARWLGKDGDHEVREGTTRDAETEGGARSP